MHKKILRLLVISLSTVTWTLSPLAEAAKQQQSKAEQLNAYFKSTGLSQKGTTYGDYWLKARKTYPVALRPFFDSWVANHRLQTVPNLQVSTFKDSQGKEQFRFTLSQQGQVLTFSYSDNPQKALTINGVSYTAKEASDFKTVLYKLYKQDSSVRKNLLASLKKPASKNKNFVLTYKEFKQLTARQKAEYLYRARLALHAAQKVYKVYYGGQAMNDLNERYRRADSLLEWMIGSSEAQAADEAPSATPFPVIPVTSKELAPVGSPVVDAASSDVYRGPASLGPSGPNSSGTLPAPSVPQPVKQNLGGKPTVKATDSPVDLTKGLNKTQTTGRDDNATKSAAKKEVVVPEVGANKPKPVTGPSPWSGPKTVQLKRADAPQGSGLTGKPCVVAGWLSYYGTGQSCGGVRGGDLDLKAQTESFTPSANCSGNAVACNPIVYGFAGVGQAHCVPRSQITYATEVCNSKSPLCTGDACSIEEQQKQKKAIIESYMKNVNGKDLNLVFDKDGKISPEQYEQISVYLEDFNGYLGKAISACDNDSTLSVITSKSKVKEYNKTNSVNLPYREDQKRACDGLRTRRLALQIFPSDPEGNTVSKCDIVKPGSTPAEVPVAAEPVAAKEPTKETCSCPAGSKDEGGACGGGGAVVVTPSESAVDEAMNPINRNPSATADSGGGLFGDITGWLTNNWWIFPVVTGVILGGICLYQWATTDGGFCADNDKPTPLNYVPPAPGSNTLPPGTTPPTPPPVAPPPVNPEGGSGSGPSTDGTR
ncbi:MAG: hypothetical protein ACOYOK_01660 [Pseudobdellovibrionaceae bacterium]